MDRKTNCIYVPLINNSKLNFKRYCLQRFPTKVEYFGVDATKCMLDWYSEHYKNADEKEF